MKKSLVLMTALSAFCCCPGFAQTLWQDLKVGMPEAEVRRLHPEKTVTVLGRELSLGLKFENDKILTGVMLACLDRIESDSEADEYLSKLKAAFTLKHGAPVAISRETYGATVYWRTSERVQIKLKILNLGGTVGTMFTVEYSMPEDTEKI